MTRDRIFPARQGLYCWSRRTGAYFNRLRSRLAAGMIPRGWYLGVA